MIQTITTAEAIALRALIAGRTYSRAASDSGLEVWQIRSLALRTGYPSVDRMVAALTGAGHPVTPAVSHDPAVPVTPEILQPGQLIAACQALDTRKARSLTRKVHLLLEEIEAEVVREREQRAEEERSRLAVKRARQRVTRARERVRLVKAQRRDAGTVREAEKALRLRIEELAAARAARHG